MPDRPAISQRVPARAEVALPDDPAGARHLAPAAAQIVESRADGAFRAWVAHVRDCRAECSTRGVDCSTARTLRTAWREAREARGDRP